ncbi:transcriptional modulator of MazE/toxin, MazF [Stanieria cyanosphaera PCC 7437]|uniref:Transcriptional modulator of MazE/toxin, MazF n=1 Tax=Stanieria cyanosphaera (strain ATCC 29371 / PCC 7437) TaxID=111780 RepID=K9XMI9_STAC7|nr:type II toxin-antitoxin system PemK/MazF family toxin [Stanieria cyanosphaera]AFZ33708.1 transcriptional modulator of MazE/toxin, MazF [Stanieria cyanosphaera PCC 7437]
MKKSGSKQYIPDRGDIIWLDFNPQIGREQAGHRPAIVISPKKFNSLSSLVFVCPISSKIKGFSFEVLLTEQMQTKGVVLIHHLRSVDWKTRGIKFVETAPISIVEEICAKLKPLIF